MEAFDSAKLTSAPDIITAVSTAPGVGAVSIIRISGQGSLKLLQKIFKPKVYDSSPEPRKMYFGHLFDSGNNLVDEVMAVYFDSPRSYTGEDMCEIQGHGGAAVTALALKTVIKAGARLAEPGEFTRRAFFNDRLDLTQAEAIADLIAAKGEAATLLAARQLGGGLSEQIKSIHQAVFSALVELTASIDFSDDLELVNLKALNERLAVGALTPLENLLDDAKSGRPYREGLRLALVGAANVGKSSLFNILAGSERAMVSPAPGTTRDFITIAAVWDGLSVELCDTAGLSSKPHDELDAMGQKRSLEQLGTADLVLWVRDATRPLEMGIDPALLPSGRSLEVWNKIDAALPPASAGLLPRAAVSAKSGLGVDELKALVLKTATGRDDPRPPEFVPNLRHQAALDEAMVYIKATLRAVEDGQPPDICALELKAALNSLDRICGRTTADDILVGIFSRFCLGK